MADVDCNSETSSNNGSRTECGCGRSNDWHLAKVKKYLTSSRRGDLNRVANQRDCDVLGEIVFCDFGCSPFVCLDRSKKGNMVEYVWDVLTNYWKLVPPRLLISVTGGAQSFILKPRLKTILKLGLINAAVKSGAWIVTGGTDAGVMKFVGEAVQEHVISMGSHHNSTCVALGVATWGVIKDCMKQLTTKERFITYTHCEKNKKEKNNTEKNKTEKNKTENNTEKNNTEKNNTENNTEKNNTKKNNTEKDKSSTNSKDTALDHNHTHFILVDDKTTSYGGEIEFRADLESYIVKKGNSKKETPCVLVVVGGGKGTGKAVSESIGKNIPVVVIDGSGEAADLIAFAYRLANTKDNLPRNFSEILAEKANDVFKLKETNNETKRAVIDSIKQCVDNQEKRKLMHIFKLDQADSVKGIQEVILKAAFKDTVKKPIDQLQLAMSWNSYDIVQEDIFDSAVHQSSDISDMLFNALKENQTEFVELFIDGEVDLKKFLTIERLTKLYEKCLLHSERKQETILLYQLLQSVNQSWWAWFRRRDLLQLSSPQNWLTLIGKAIVYVMKDAKFNFYAAYEDLEKWKGLEFEFPERELLLWAILFNRVEFVHLFWRKGRDHLGGALFIAALSKSLSKIAENKDSEKLSQSLATQARKYETMAATLLTQCASNDDKVRAHLLLVRKLPHWVGVKSGNCISVLTLAESYELMDFTLEPMCKTKITSIWRGNMAPLTSKVLSFFTIILPPLVWFIDFKKVPRHDFSNCCCSRKIGADNQPPENVCSIRSNDNSLKNNNLPMEQHSVENKNSSSTHGIPEDTNDDKSVGLYDTFKRVFCCSYKKNRICFFPALYSFYQAPVTKFMCDCISYAVLLGVFSYFVLVDLTPIHYANNLTTCEIITWCWVSTLFIEDIRQLMTIDKLSLRYKVLAWWKRYRLLMYGLLLLSVILRCTLTDNFVWARIMYSLTLGVFFLRLLFYFYADSDVGPKVVMIRKMLTDLKVFILLLIVFVLSFGVTYHANMFPGSVPSWWILAKVVYFPYFQMYGELFLAEMKGEDIEGCSRNETVWRESPQIRCPTNNALVLILTAVYLMLTMILLVNLLIAMLNHTFTEVHKDSDKIWNYYKLSLVYEYSKRPFLVPPLIIFNHIYLSFCKCNVKGPRAIDVIDESDKQDGAFIVNVSEELNTILTTYERVCMEKILLDNNSASTPHGSSVKQVRPKKHRRSKENLQRKIKRPLAMRTGNNSHKRSDVTALKQEIERLRKTHENMINLLDEVLANQKRNLRRRRTTRTSTFDTNTKSSTSTFDTNAKSSTLTFDTNAKSSALTFDTNAKSSTSNFDSNAKPSTMTFHITAKSSTSIFHTSAHYQSNNCTGESSI